MEQIIQTLSGDFSGLIFICLLLFSLGVLVILAYYLYKKYQLDKEALLETTNTQKSDFSVVIKKDGKNQEFEIPEPVHKLIISISNERDLYRQKLTRALNGMPFGTTQDLN